MPTQVTPSSSSPMPGPSKYHNVPATMIEDPVVQMFALYQQRFIGKKRISYPREYKLAAIDQVKCGKTR